MYVYIDMRSKKRQAQDLNESIKKSQSYFVLYEKSVLPGIFIL